MTPLVWATVGMHHGAVETEHGPVEWMVVSAAAIILLWALGLALRYTVRPGESDASHIKHRILVDETDSIGPERPR